ncbi:MAG: glycosyltransferase family 2 protein [Actinomycetota bacterium]|nr:glycosyltransferase family 2 protein [Actinomycetota bacterium]
MTPDVSVVIPTLGRVTRLAFALEALAEQTLAPDRFEVIVVGAAGRTRGLEAGVPDGLQVSLLEAPAPTASAKRNHGWRAARGAVIAFTDDDCRPAPDWLERLITGVDGSLTFAQGRTEPDPDEECLLRGSAQSVCIRRPSEWFETCNIAYSRALLERLGGFDEDFEYGGEDTDLGLRAVAVGARQIYIEGALAWHAVHPRSPLLMLRNAPPHPTTSLVFARHPRQRRFLYQGLFWNRRQARVLAMLTAAAVLGPSPRAAAALAIYMVPEVRAVLAGSPPQTPRAAVRTAYYLSELMARDLVLFVNSVRRSIETRSPVL